MADQKRWFKLWCSAPGDDDLQALPPEIRWAWAALGCYTKEHGTNGMIQINDSNKVLAAEMGVELSALKETISVLPHVHIEEGTNSNGRFTVTWDNWNKYQEDSTGAERQRALRSKRRGEEKRGDKKKSPPSTSPSVQYEDSWIQEPWPSVKRFVAEHNTGTPEWWPTTTTLSTGVREKIAQYLKQFPRLDWWQLTFQNLREAQDWLREYHGKGLGWLLQLGKHDRIENCVKVHDGRWIK